MAKFSEKNLVEAFRERESFSREELFDYLLRTEPDLNEGTFAWRVYDLKRREILKPVKRGYYTFSFKPKYKPPVSAEISKLVKEILSRYDEIKYCIWDTQWLNEFSQHQSGKRMIIIEAEKDFIESIFYFLKEKFSFNFFLEPDEKTIDYYISESAKPVIIKKLISRSPVQKSVTTRPVVITPALEKILVDLYCEKKLFYYFQGSELAHICENAVKNYTLNFSKLFNYARRREQGEGFKTWFLKQTDYLIKDLYHD